MAYHFLQRTAKFLSEKYGDKIGEVQCIFPNRRAMLFFQKELAVNFDTPIWSPKMYTTDDLVKSVTSFSIADRLTLIYRLNKIRERITGTEESLESFYFWGNQLIADFDEVDKHLAPSDQLFAYIKDVSEIDALYGDLHEELKERLVLMWDLNGKPDSKFGNTWKNLGPMYDLFRKELKEDGLAYNGMVYRAVAEDPQLLSDFLNKPIAIIGFNRLDKSQRTIFQYLQQHGETLFFWQDHDALLKDKVASKFLKINQQLFPNSLQKLDTYSVPEKIQIIPASGITNQAQVISHIINNSEYSGSEVACILPEESILQPLLRSLPDKIDTINVTLGLPLRQTQGFTLIDAFFDMHSNAKRSFGNFKKNDVERLIRHPYLAMYFQLGTENEIKLNSEDGTPFFYIKPEQLDFKQKVIQLLFAPLDSEVKELLLRLISVVTEAYELMNANEGNEYHLEILMKTHAQLQRLYDILLETGMTFSEDGILQIIRSIFHLARVPFKGEPLQGMQIMGPLEAQNLHFNLVCFSSMNEGVFPPGYQESYIPNILRNVFHLPSPEDTAAEYAYYFWSSILPAKEVVICYDTDQSGLGAKEASRLIQQLKLQPGNWPIQFHSVEKYSPLSSKVDVSIEKNAKTLKALNERVKIGFSPTNINDYVICSLKFYLKQIAGIKEPKLSSSADEPHIIGLVIHDVLEELYKPFLNKHFSSAIKDSLIVQLPFLVDKHMQLQLNLPEKMTQQGYAFLVRGIILQYLEKVINYDINNNDFILKGLEDKEQKTTFKLSNGREIHLRGIIDRWEERGDRLQIIDYKTGGYKLGSSNQKRTEVSSMEALFGLGDGKKQPKEALQSLIYAWMLGRNPEYMHRKIDASLYFVRAMGEEGYNPLVVNKASGKSIVEDIEFNADFEPMLIKLLEEILDEKVPFTMTEDEDACRYCPYNVHCNRV